MSYVRQPIEPSLSIVIAAHNEARTIAARIALALSGAGAAVVSGLAYGIDGASHEATLRAGGTTVAVIGGGHAVGAPGGPLTAPQSSAVANGNGVYVYSSAPAFPNSSYNATNYWVDVVFTEP